MNKELISAIREENWAEIRRIAFALPEEEKAFFKDKFTYHNVQEIYPETPKTHRYGANKEFAVSYAMMCICTNLKELAEVENRLDFGFYGRRYYQQKYLFLFLISQQAQAFIDFLHTPQGAYMAEGAQKMYIEYPNYLSFEMLLALYKEGLLPFNEEIFVKRMYAMEYHRTQEELVVQLLSQNPELATRVIPHTAKYIDYTLGSNLEWKKVFTLLCKKNYFPDKSFITSFVEVLLNPWKKNVLDMYCRWIEGLAPTEKELLPSQHTLFALLTLDKSSLINFAMKCIAQISTHPAFDFQAFADNFALCFTVPKIAKSQLIGVEILEKYYQKQAPTNRDYREQLAVLFTVPDTKLQEKVASLLTTYFSGEGLAEVVAPYQDYLKIPTPVPPSEGRGASLNSTQETATTPPTLSPYSEEKEVATTLLALCPPSGKSARAEYVEGMLFLLGDCLREPAAHTIDVFLEGLITLQDDFPADWAKSLSPYIKQLTKRKGNEIPTDTILLGVLCALIDQRPLTLDPKCSYTWEEMNQKRKKLSEKEFETYTRDYYLDKARQVLPFLFRKGQMVIDAILEHCHLPLLSTPTHLPFYIEAEVLVDKLLQYEAQSKAPDLDDLIVACNRLLFKEVSAAAKEKAKQLKGDYAKAIQYYLGITDDIQLTEELLPLWAQITRIKYPDREFPEFATTSAKDILGVVKPYLIDYGWQEDDGHKEFTFGHHTKWVGISYTDLKNAFPYRYYNANGGCSPISTIFEYKLSLNPHYPDAMLCDYISTWVTGNEVREVRNMSLPLEVLLHYDIRVRHSGWLYIGTALLFEKRPSRDLAYEYICQAIAHGEDLSYLKTYLAQVLAWDYLPIPRFIEFLDRPNPPAVKAFGKEVVALYLEEVKKQEKLPRYHKKLAAFGD
ncbi:hypothetical protein SAMN05444420_1045 [Capnocytophaga granulosa]|uniref:Uncharacterized protein n=1 Tax=Capnocytophaga granulosa TaxID=45242 RepID=A0A1H2W7W8_9FLAO|nr:DUF6493 family protein [Capnocytophaga granulosa]EPD27972.1 hypothetical protein HMPREF9331_01724 [Capnocytophaga granulosa ATCC 51502]SDW76742.1 hypothetical protein SAMN05444420_1045 [Capnocytophaga granulosa]SUX20143.1 Uncharacterised protein [Capnocytophaga granulosa]SUX93747.1 Uncharacterised protein [Capnocytophaga granulosa]